MSRTSTLTQLPGASSTFDANDRLTSDAYDPNGNTTNGYVFPGTSAVSDRYDFEDHLINRNAGQVTVVYDGDGNRVAKTVGGVTTLFLVDDRNPSGYAQVLEEHTLVNSATTTLNRAYTYGSDLISQDQWTGSAWQLNFYGYDGHGSVRYLTSTNAAITDTYDYDAFGTLIAQSGATPNNYLYCGEQFDPDLGLYYNRARYLDVDSGRFWTTDLLEGTLSDLFSLHRYLYAKTDAINNADPSGLETLTSQLEAVGIDGNNQKTQTPTGVKAYRKVTKTVVCNMGRLTFTTVLAVSGGHHVWPKFMGGPKLQYLAKLSPEVHAVLHKLIYLIAKNEPLLKDLSALGGANGSSEAWEAAMQYLLKVEQLLSEFCDWQRVWLTNGADLCLLQH